MQSHFAKLSKHERTRREILAKTDLIPPLSDAVVRALAMLNNANTAPQDLEEPLLYDPVLVAKMLSLVNSPFYGVSRQIRSIRDAVVVLGFRGLRSLLLATGSAKLLSRNYRCYGHGSKGLWKHSVAVASSAKHIAKSCGHDADQAEELFVAGLLHDIGKMMLAPYLPESGPVSHGRDTTAAERAALGIDHAEAGGLIATQWNLGPVVAEVLRRHHDTGEAGMQPEVTVVRLADHLAHEMGYGFERSRHGEGHLDPADLELLGLSTHAWTQIRESNAEQVGSALAELENITS